MNSIHVDNSHTFLLAQLIIMLGTLHI